MFSVQFDEKGHFTGNYAEVGVIEGGIMLETVPDEKDELKLKSYMYGAHMSIDSETGKSLVKIGWYVDEFYHNSLLCGY